MSRPVGVTVSAIVAILGCILALLMAVLSLGSLFVQTGAHTADNSPQIIAGAFMFTVLSGFGICTAIGILQLRPWARMSMVIFAGVLVVGSAFMLLATMTIPMSPDISTGTVRQVRRMMAMVSAVPIAIGLWWLIQFNTKSTKAAFAAELQGPASTRPISITVIAWFSIFGGSSCLLAILARSPAFLFGATIEGWMAGVIYGVFGVLTLYVGKGLLELREEARILGIGWSAFSLVHTCAVWLVPPIRRRLFDLSESLAAAQDPRTHVAFPSMLMNVVFAWAVVTLLATIWFLIRHRGAFNQTNSH